MESFFDFTITPFYYIGMAVWKIMLILIGVTAGETPQAFSEGTWNYITQSLYPLFLAIGSTLLNVFFLIGYLRSVSNLRDGMTLEMFIELCIKVALGNLVIQSIIPIMEQIFNLAGGISKLLIAGTDNPFVQSDMDGGAIFFYAVFGIIYFAVCLVSSVTIFLTVYGRYLQLQIRYITFGVMEWMKHWKKSELRKVTSQRVRQHLWNCFLTMMVEKKSEQLLKMPRNVLLLEKWCSNGIM